jgi:DNA primase
VDAAPVRGVLLMAIDKALAGGEMIEGEESAVEIEIVNPEAVSIETPDGGVVIDFDPEAEDLD